MTTPIPFSQIQQGFQDQLSAFEHYAQQGMPLGSLVNTTQPEGNLSTPVVQKASLAGDLTNKMIFGPFSSDSISRLVAAVLGLIMIAGAVYLFKPEAVQSVVRKGAVIAV